MMESPESFLSSALEFVKLSRKAILEVAQSSIASNLKDDKSFVTAADTAAEKALREAISKKYPTHLILGEEFSGDEDDSGYLWTIDPIDGTQNFVHGIPTYGTILALRFRGETLACVVDHPALGLVYYAHKGGGAFCNGAQISIKDSKITGGLDSNEIIATSTRGMFERSSEGALLDRFMQHHGATRIYYDIFSTTQVAHGRLGALVEFNVTLWDIGATQLLVEEAGGRYERIRYWRDSKGTARYSLIIGKPSVVEFLLPQFR